LLLCLGLIVLLGGILRVQSTHLAVDENILQSHNDSGAVQIKGLVAADPEPAGGALSLRLEAREIKVGDTWEQVSGSALVYVSAF
jgi:hypothetical protein